MTYLNAILTRKRIIIVVIVMVTRVAWVIQTHTCINVQLSSIFKIKEYIIIIMNLNRFGTVLFPHKL